MNSTWKWVASGAGLAAIAAAAFYGYRTYRAGQGLSTKDEATDTEPARANASTHYPSPAATPT